MGECPAKYKNLNKIQSFSEQRYATVQLFEQICQNDEYLKQKFEELSYLTPPAVRKRFCPILLDDVHSFGCQTNRGTNTVTFSSATQEVITIDFNDFDYIDMNKTDVEFESVASFNEGVVTGTSKQAVIPILNKTTENTDTKNMDETPNAYYYVGYDSAKTYQVRPDWLENWKDLEIPAIGRAQTFKVASTVESGSYIDSVDVYVGNRGAQGSNWAHPLYVRLYTVKKQTFTLTRWDESQRKYVPQTDGQGNIKTTDVYVPDSKGSYPQNNNITLATGSFQPNKIEPGLINIKFDKKVKVSPNQMYALVFSSPLSHPDHCPTLGGYSRKTTYDNYSGGRAYMSEDNCRTWKMYGIVDENSLKQNIKNLDAYPPTDFAFRIHCVAAKSSRTTNTPYYLYTKPIQANPIRKVSVNYYGSGNETSIVFEVSHNGRDWQTLDSNHQVTFSPLSETGEYPTMVIVRAKLTTASADSTPYINSITITLDCDLPSTLYARTHYYYPKTTQMLGATHWGRVFAPFSTDPSVTGSVEIISEKVSSEHFDIITAQELENYTWIEGLNTEKITDDDLDVRYQYLINNPSAITLLKEYNVYVLPYSYEVNSESVTDLLSFADGVQLAGHPAYPLQRCVVDPSASDTQVECAEWVDYVVDYDNNVLTFFSETDRDDGEDDDLLMSMPVGTLEVKYNPIFIEGLTNQEVGVRSSNDEGLILDYFKETILITEEMVENRRVPLRVAPVDPVRQVLLDGEEINEDIDFTMNYLTNELVFPADVMGTDATSLTVNSELVIVYTPALEDTGIAIGYRGNRENKDKQMIIKPNYLEYKV